LVRETGGRIVSGVLARDGDEAFFARDLDGKLLGFQDLPQESFFTSRNFSDNGSQTGKTKSLLWLSKSIA
jgi:hypothetical protein